MCSCANAVDNICVIRFLAQVICKTGSNVELAYAGGAAVHTGSYRVKFRKNEFMDLVQMAQPSVIYHVRRMHFFAHDGFVMYSLESKSEDFSIKVVHAMEFSNTHWNERELPFY